MKKLFLGLFILFNLLNTSTLKASHYAGADLTYKCLGGNTYLISLSLYRDCSGIVAPPTVAVNIKCNQNQAYNFSTNLPQIIGTGQEVTQACSITPSICSGGIGYGVQEYVYEATVTLVPCKDWNISYTSCCRNPVTTISNNIANSWYIQAFLNNYDAPCNNSPHFSNHPPIMVQIGTNFTFNHGAIDPDGDSLSYSFYTPFTDDSTTSIIYNTGYSDTIFLISSTPITLNKHTGEINFTPTLEELTVTGIKVEEWRKINGVPTLIGIVYRDMQLKTYSNTNSLPQLSGMDFSLSHHYNPNDTIYNLVAILGPTIDFDINGFDVDTFSTLVDGRPDEFNITWNNGIPQGTFTTYYNGTDSAYSHFYWTPTSADVSFTSKCFTATITDEACPYNGSQTFTYCIEVIPNNVGIESNLSEIPINTKITPNPSDGIFELTIEGKSKDNFQYQLINISGEIIEEGEIQNQGFITTQNFNFNQLPKGIYLFKIINTNFIKTNRLVIQ